MKHIKNFVFDLDSTLYPSSVQTEKLVNEKIISFYKNVMNVQTDDYYSLLNIWRLKYGSDIIAVTKMGYDKAYFLDYICDVDVSKIDYNDSLLKQLKKLNKDKFIYTDSSFKHVMDVFERLKLGDVFETKNIFTAKDGGYICKSNGSIPIFLKKYALKANETIIFEDSQKNLIVAKEYGLITVFINDRNDEKYSHCDFMVKDINEALALFLED